MLIVDDIAITRMQLAAQVRELGFRISEAANGEAALACMAEQTPDIVLLDLLMPGMDGFTVSRIIKGRDYGRWIPIVVLSGLEGEEHLLKALEAHADDFLHKPVNPAILSNKLGNLRRVLTLQAQHNSLLSRSQAISRNSFDAILLADPSLRICEANPAAAILFGQSLGELLGQPLSALLPDLQPACTSSGPATLVKLDVLRPDASLIPVEAGLGSFAQDGASYLLITLRDISERVRADQLKQQFIATLSHELRTPLTSIIGALKMLQADTASLTPQQHQLLAMADRNSGRLLGMVNELLDLNRSQAGKLQLVRHAAQLGDLLDEAVASHLGYAQRHAVNLELDCSAPVRLQWLNTDHGRFLQIMANLLSNACKFSAAGDTVTIRAAREGTQLSIAVSDHGPGIPADFLPRLFEPFTQADGSDSRRQGGSGLGLAITRQLVEALEGQIQVSTTPGEGSTFTLYFPVGAPA
ncbi:ATP-binding response regulator [Chitinilyticum piscinae]|uniref:histidine kinase n=1 Tax=Chitinilyticum piscinae TaxID=2866724 RepID=A0A8J7KAW3_9NEIS|nr:ATP-binding protein [Chitinilyticum piscinae]MBE9609544.1 response regulator [Chitinilyticum piscinae]